MLSKASSATFDGESEEARLARRKLNWIGNVEYEEVVPDNALQAT